MKRAREETIEQGGRAKAYRPMPPAERRASLEAGLDAYDRGDFFMAHELLEPAWMGARDGAERELLQGLIKLAAAYVHAARSNPAGVAKNLRGALARVEAGRDAGVSLGIEVEGITAAIRARLGRLDGSSETQGGAADGAVMAIDPIPISRRPPQTATARPGR